MLWRPFLKLDFTGSESWPATFFAGDSLQSHSVAVMCLRAVIFRFEVTPNVVSHLIMKQRDCLKTAFFGLKEKIVVLALTLKPPC